MTNVHSQWNDCMYGIFQCIGNKNSIPRVKWRANWCVINSSTCHEFCSRYRAVLLNDRNTEDCVVGCDVEVHKHSSRTYRNRCGLTASTLIHCPNYVVDCVWNVMAHAQKPDFFFRRNGRVHLNRQGRQFSRLLEADWKPRCAHQR